jgi:hypothetical protein
MKRNRNNGQRPKPTNLTGAEEEQRNRKCPEDFDGEIE